MLKHFQQGLKNDLIAGLLVVIPLATTIWLTITVASWVIRWLTKFPKQLSPFNDLHPALVALINLGIGFAVPLLAILLIGLMARNIAGRWLLDLGERILQSIPLAGSVYKTLKQLLETVLQDTKSQFSRVVLVEYPRRGIWAIAFVTSSVTSMNPDSKMLSVFVPTTPNPTSGWYAVVPETDVVNLSISIEEAFKVLLSGGIVGPNLAEALVNQSAVLPEEDSEDSDNSAADHTIAEQVDPKKPNPPETTVELVNIDQQA
ncbi:hypothetical protein N836_29395 [Leptolyngbya sp. Heron Island J]|uniref:DUF502 domain-containing protein n=1 Tax=Leptolyngbya sp. Heron Island J TaxID=1385935 RepID=UPI0003B9CC61|nr:DUF502 domain-containing protein [Leptolyngbya sp. Heron Island J]ESA39071.1 hypothetical protein N836_29395 [Leptolyngbya sp. Heron Island J]